MSRRSIASVMVFCLAAALIAVAALLPVPYVTMNPGPTVNVLGRAGARPIIAVTGHRTYPTKGQMRLTTVSVTNPTATVRLGEALRAWFDRTDAVYPRDVIYPPDESPQESQQQSDVEMVSSQDTAIAAALTELGYRLPLQTEVLAVTKGSPADGKLKTRDRILRINGTRITKADQVSKAIQAAGVGKTSTFVVRRGNRNRTVRVTSEPAPGHPKVARVGVQIGTGYDFPFDVSVRLGEQIGGPSAGLIFSLGVYDTLTPGSLIGGGKVAGTGTIDEHGNVGPIGGIQQKIVAAADAGATLFLVPPDNCDSALAADVTKDEIKLVKAPTMHSAVRSLRAYAANKNASLPACG